jgi:predicted ester cyclase
VIDDLIAEGDKVVKRWSSRGTHQLEFAGIPATSKQVTFTGTTTYRLAGGKIVEAWWSDELFGMLEQLGAIPAPAEPAVAAA